MIGYFYLWLGKEWPFIIDEEAAPSSLPFWRLEEEERR
jgi:hypothetical protein